MHKTLFSILSTLTLTLSLSAQQATDLTVTLPDEGKLVDEKPVGEGWESLIDPELTVWESEPEYWSVKDGVMHGESKGGQHHHAYTKKEHKDFELHAVIKMAGNGANSGVCIRLKPTNFDNCPGYQVDMGPGYWGCLWEERRAGMVQRFPKNLADQLVHSNDWNHYYILAKGHHIQAWLNGVKTIDIVHEKGFPTGRIGFQLCHGKKETIVDVKTLMVRELNKTE
ncbi:MAG: DUF1080 domain-containing protein [Planctomycetota bacterium]|nr:DUF1080 domain-containing protein [Planctomycetota bacterium]MDA1142238.1 DUF1080 domain-containing protein [Planctomycetota bacterium]